MKNISHIFNLNNIKIFGVFLCLLFILSNSLIVFDYPQNMSNIPNINGLANEFLESHQLIFHITLFFLIFSIFTKNFTIYHLYFITIIGSTIFSFRLLDEHLHNALVNYNIYPNSFKHGGFQVNPQYTKLILFSLFTFILLIQNLFKKYRTRSKSFALLGVSAILFTVFIFHNVVPKGSLQYQKEQQIENIHKFFRFSTETQKDLCKTTYTCFQAKNFDEFYNITNKYNVAQARINYFVKNDKFEDSLITGTFDNNGRFKILTVGYKIFNQESNLALFIIEENKTMYAQNLSEIQFSYLAIYANTFWLLFTWFLIWMHNQKWRFKIFPTST